MLPVITTRVSEYLFIASKIDPPEWAVSKKHQNWPSGKIKSHPLAGGWL